MNSVRSSLMRPLSWSISYLLRFPLGISMVTSNSTRPRSSQPWSYATSVDHGGLGTAIETAGEQCDVRPRGSSAGGCVPDERQPGQGAPMWPTDDEDRGALT